MSFTDSDQAHRFCRELIDSFQGLDQRQGSQAFDSVISASQYLPAYEWVIAQIPRGAAVLDWGCGTGHFSHFLDRFGYAVTPFGFEEPDFLAHIDSHCAKNFVKATHVTTLPFESNTFDAVVSIGVLEHVREFKGSEIGSLREINRVLRPGGYFFCYHLPNKFSWIEGLSAVLGRWHHEYRFTAGEIARLCQAAGLKMDDCRRYGVLPRNMMGSSVPGRLLGHVISPRVFETADDVLERLLPVIAQNYMFTAQKF